MKLFRYLLPLLVALGFTSSAIYADSANDRFGDEARFNEELNERDWDALLDYINTKRTINVAEKATNLTISGDVRTEWRHIQEKRLGQNLRGHGRKLPGDCKRDCNDEFNVICHDEDDCHCEPISRDDYDIEANLFVEYSCDNTWGVIQLQFDNAAGIDGTSRKCPAAREGLHGSGFGDSINLKRAYLGYNLYCCEGTRFDIEIGRRPLYTIFDSNVQFLNRFDGILVKYDSNCEYFADWYLHMGAFIVDEKVNHSAFVSELGLLDVCDSGFDFKYSFITWKKHWWNNGGRNRCDVTDARGSRFCVSQFTTYYHLEPEMLCAPAQFYGAVLWNTAARKKSPIFTGVQGCESGSGSDSSERSGGHHKRENFAWYAGFTLGDVICEGDWSVDVQYQYVEARAVPDEDVSGIGRGNVLNESVNVAGRGNTNFKGWRLQGLYAVTDNLSLDARVQWSTQIKKRIGGKHSYSEYRLQAIYAF
ncbi:putative uncharacterized protein [Parachlamydia acanthamoebae UV-7]|uniref:Uncharacterized protein n=2 Tax=Parachlamydia acanthamoebae TaxID=83552 RepID=F8KY47_PARAV|nr:putative porin [Parachlamydia acanthamoebae]CCB87700.1 putative uncharacterized protein [Parachlamydia acanthamoebae UV-7]